MHQNLVQCFKNFKIQNENFCKMDFETYLKDKDSNFVQGIQNGF